MKSNLEMTTALVDRFLEEADKMNPKHSHIMKWILISTLVRELEVVLNECVILTNQENENA